MKRHLWLVALLAAFAIPTTASAQRLERTKLLEVGDKLTYTYVLKGVSLHAVEEVVEVTDTEIRLNQKIGNRTYKAVVSARNMSRVAGICIANSQACQFSPGERWVDFPLETGRTWSSTFTTTGETFVSEVTQERKVGGIEKIKTPAGEFQAYKVSSTGRGAWRLKWSREGPWNHVTESSTYWWTAIKGKLVLVKQEYENSGGARSSRELVSAQLN